MMNIRKKTVVLLLAIVFAILAPVSVSAAESGTSVSGGQCGDNVTWQFDDSNGQLTVSGTGAMWKWNQTMWNRDKVKTVVIKKGVTSVGESAFFGDRALTSVTLPDSITLIGEDAFDLCENLTAVTIPDSVKTIGISAFAECGSLSRVTIPDSVTSIGDFAFGLCKSLKNVTIPDSVTAIGRNAFSHTSLTSVKLPPSITAISDYTFFGCEKLTDITITDSVTKIGNYAFMDCNSLTNVTIPDSVTVIYNGAFRECKNLTGITIPDSVTYIGYYTFYDCRKLQSIEVGSQNRNYAAKDGILFSKDYSKLICYPAGKTESSFTVPKSVTVIDGVSICFCFNLKKMTIPENVTTIGNFAFTGCWYLESISIPKSVTRIGEDVFDSCPYISDVYYGGSEEEWQSIIGSDDSKNLTDATIHYHSQMPASEPVEQSFAILSQPANVVAKAGETVTFTIKVQGVGVSYSWEYSYDGGRTRYGLSQNLYASPIGVFATSTDSCSITLTDKNSEVYVYCTVIDQFRQRLVSDVATAKVKSSAPSITAQPTSIVAKNGASVSFKVAATGAGLTYQWQLSDNAGKTWRNSSTKTATYSTTLSDKNNGRYVRCIVTDKYGSSVKSNAASMKITTLKITAQPVSQTLKKGATVSFKVAATGAGLTYQWQLSDDAGKTWRNSSTKTANYSTTLSDKNNGRYVRCIVTDKYGNSVKSGAASMKITTLKITAQPVNQTVKKGATVSFKVAATGSGLTYQWQLSDDAGKTWRDSSTKAATYSTTLSDKNNGRYVRCIVTDKYGNSVKSGAASMKIK